MKLTAQIAAGYFGCTVKYKKWKCPMHSISSDYMDLEDNLGDYHTDVPYSDCQLLLTPLSEISDEDAIEVAKIEDKNVEYFKGNNHKATINRYVFIRNEVDGKVYIGIDRFCNSNYYGYTPLPQIASLYSIEQIDYLRSRGYDCGFMEIKSLISAGIAFKK